MRRSYSSSGVLLIALTLTACTGSPPRPSSVTPAPSQVAQGASVEVQGLTANLSARCEQAADRADVDIESVVRGSLAAVGSSFPNLRTRVDVGTNPSYVIPEVGVGGYTDPFTGAVTISLDPSFVDQRSMLTVWLPFILAHELDHAERILHGPGYGDTLLENMVSEGLADAFAIQTFADTPTVPWDHALSSEQERSLWGQARTHLDELLTTSEYDRWFLGSGEVPRWTGYTLGYSIVSSYLERGSDRTAATATRSGAGRILRLSAYTP